MIKLTVEDYCQNCPEFEADVIKTKAFCVDEVINHTTITCEHRDKCAQLKSYIERNTNKNDIT